MDGQVWVLVILGILFANFLFARVFRELRSQMIVNQYLTELTKIDDLHILKMELRDKGFYPHGELVIKDKMGLSLASEKVMAKLLARLISLDKNRAHEVLEAVLQYSSAGPYPFKVNTRTYWGMVSMIHNSIEVTDQIENTRIKSDFLRDAKITEILHQVIWQENKKATKEEDEGKRFKTLSSKASEKFSKKLLRFRFWIKPATIPAAAAEGKPK